MSYWLLTRAAPVVALCAVLLCVAIVPPARAAGPASAPSSLAPSPAPDAKHDLVFPEHNFRMMELPRDWVPEAAAVKLPGASLGVLGEGRGSRDSKLCERVHKLTTAR
jgi:hypothetical protein